MKYQTNREADAALNQSHAFERLIEGGRIIIYADHTDKAGRNLRFWLCFQVAVDFPCRFTVGGQVYLDKDGQWREPHGASHRKHFSTPAAASKAAMQITNVP